MIVLAPNTALIVIDVQVGLDDPKYGERSNPDAERNIARLLERWRARKRPIFHIQHMSVHPESPLRPGLPGNAIKPIVAPIEGEPVITKTVNNAFVGTDLADRLYAAGVTTVVVVGLTAEHCVSTTARMAGDLDFKTLVIADATASHEKSGYDGERYPAAAVHQHALIALQDEFAIIMTTDQLLAADE